MAAFIGPANQTCGWPPCACSAKNRVDGLKGRACFHWRMLPGIIALAADIVALACAIIWNSPFLCIAFGPGALASLYLIYLGWDFQQLKTFSENNAQLKTSIETLELQNAELGRQVQRLANANAELTSALLKLESASAILRQENDKLGASVTHLDCENRKLDGSVKDLGAISESLRQENSTLIQSKSELQETVVKLEAFKKNLEEKAALHVLHLEVLQSSLKSINDAAQSDHSTFSKNLQLFIQQIERLQQTRSSFEKTGTEVEEKIRKEVEVLLSATETLKSIFCQIEDWKNTELVSSMISNQDRLKKDISELEKQLSRGEGQRDELNAQIEALRKLKQDFEASLTKLAEKVETLENTTDGLGDVKADLHSELEMVRQMLERQKESHGYSLGQS